MPARLKWPNDVLVDGGKICGVLCEMVTPAEAAGDELVVVGAGANVDQHREELPVDTATSLRLCGVTGVRREDLVLAFLDRLRRAARGLGQRRCGDAGAPPAVPRPVRHHRAGRPGAPALGCRRAGSRRRRRRLGPAGARRPRRRGRPTRPVTSSTCGRRPEGAGPWPPGMIRACLDLRDATTTGAVDPMPPEVDDLVIDDVAARLLGEPRSMRRRQVRPGAEVSLLSARKFWHALGFPNVDDEDTVFTDGRPAGAAVGRRAGPRRGVRRDDRAVDDPGARAGPPTGSRSGRPS